MATHQRESDLLIADYLRELKVSAWIRGLSRSQTATLQVQVRSNIDAALAQAADRDEATVYRVLDQLGPASAFVDRLTAAPRSRSEQVRDTLLTPVTRIRAAMAAHSWGLAEIGGLLLLVVGPFVLWWIGPIFGIALIQYGANRWSPTALRRATRLVFVLLAFQALLVVGLFIYVVIDGGPFVNVLQRVLRSFGPAGSGQLPPMPVFGGLNMSPLQILMGLPAFVAGIGSGVYLALSPRHRPGRSGSVEF